MIKLYTAQTCDKKTDDVRFGIVKIQISQIILANDDWRLVFLHVITHTMISLRFGYI